MYKLFLDDLRAPPDGTWVVARSVAAAVEYVKTYGPPIEMSLDHDLGSVDAPAFLHWIIDADLNGEVRTQNILKFNVHSANPAGAQNLRALWDSWNKFKETN